VKSPSPDVTTTVAAEGPSVESLEVVAVAVTATGTVEAVVPDLRLPQAETSSSPLPRLRLLRNEREISKERE